MSRRALFILLGVIAFFLVLGLGAIAGGAVTYFALQARSVKAAVAIQTDVSEESGILIAAMEPDSPADQAGLVRGDILIEANGKEINNAKDLFDILADAQAEDTLELTLLHGSELRSVNVTLGERDDHVFLGIRPCGQLSLERRLLHEFERLDFSGAMIREIVPDSPAEEAGLKVGEVILSVDGEALKPETDLSEVIRSYKPGDTITLEVKRLPEEGSREVQVTLRENPDQEGQAYLGVRYAPFPIIRPFEGQEKPFRIFPFPEFDGERLPFPHPPFEDFPFAPHFPGLPEGLKQAVIVAEVTPDSPAEKAGLQKGDLITAIDGEAVGRPQEFVETIRSHVPGDQITLTVYSPGEDQATEIEVRLGENPEKPGETYLGVRIGGFFKRD